VTTVENELQGLYQFFLISSSLAMALLLYRK